MALRPWIGGVQSLALHAVVLSGLGVGWRFAIAPSEADFGRTPLGCAFQSPTAMPIQLLPPGEMAIDAPAADAAEVELAPLPADGIAEGADEADAVDSAPTPIELAKLDAMAFLADAAPMPRPRSRRGEDIPVRTEDAPIAAAQPSREAAPQASSSAQPNASRILKRVDPTYPRTALRLGRQGVVHVRMTITESGRVVEAVAEVSSGSPDLDEAALSAVRQWEFERASAVDARPRVITIQIRFQLTS